MQDAHGLSAPLLLWCLWTGADWREAEEIVIRKAVDIDRKWGDAVVAPLRGVRRHLKSADPMLADASAALRATVKDVELQAEKAVMTALEALADQMLRPAEGGSADERARRNLAAYVRMTDAARTPGFSISLLESLIALSLPPSDSPALRAERSPHV